MKKIIREVDAVRGIIQITIADERWYQIDGEWWSSVTWIASHYPKGTAYYKWLAQKGWDEAQAIKVAAGDKGSKVHAAIVDLIDGKDVQMDDRYSSAITGLPEELSLEEWECLMSFVAWYQDEKPKILAREITVANTKYKYAGTIDLLYQDSEDSEIVILDFKTSQDIWPEHELQLSAYRHGDTAYYPQPMVSRTEILQLGYRKNKRGYKLTEIEDKFNLFLAAREIWQNEQAGVEPKKRDYPMNLSLTQTTTEKAVENGDKGTKRSTKVATAR